MTDPFLGLVASLARRRVRFVVIGVWGANLWARSGGMLFATQDRDLLLPLEPANELAACEACIELGFQLSSADEPLGSPLDLWLAERIVSNRALVRATDGRGLDVDLSLVMAGFDFEAVFAERRVFAVDGVEVPVARLRHIVASKAAAGRDKDRLFLAAHAEALKDLMKDD